MKITEISYLKMTDKIITASRRGRLEIVKELIKAGANVNGTTAIFHASRNGHLKIVKELIKTGDLGRFEGLVRNQGSL